MALFIQDTGRPAPAVPDRIYPQFIWDYLPPGVAGLVMAAILAAAMSNLSAALNSLASTTVMDFWKPLARKERTEAEYLRIARWVTLFWGGVLLIIAFLARHVQSVLEYGLGIASIIYGALLGTFLLGVLTERVAPRHSPFRTTWNTPDSTKMRSRLGCSRKSLLPAPWPTCSIAT